MTRIRALFTFVLVPLALVAAVHSLELWRTLAVEPYQDGATPVYLDRPYVNTAPAAALAGQRIVRLPRHLLFDVELELSGPARVMRLLSDANDNTRFADWEPLAALRVNVPGRSCVLTRAVVKGLAPGRHRLAPGGPIATAPLLVASDGEIRARSRTNWNKLTPASDPQEFVTRNGSKLAGLALTYAGYCWALLRWRTRR